MYGRRQLIVWILWASGIGGCVGPIRPADSKPPLELPVERCWMVPLSHRPQQAQWHGYMLLPDTLVSPIVREESRILSVDAQHIGESFSRRLRMVERDMATGKVLYELALPWDVPANQESCRILKFAGRWHVVHPPWTGTTAGDGIVLPWPLGTPEKAPNHTVAASILPPEMARALDDARAMNTDGTNLLVATAFSGRGSPDSRRWLAVAVVDVTTPKLLLKMRAEIPFPIERSRGGVRVGRAGSVILARASIMSPTGPKRFREVFAAFSADEGRLLWCRAASPRQQPPAFEWVADDQSVYVHTEDTAVEAWDLHTGKPKWRCDVGSMIVSDARLCGTELIAFGGNGYPAAGSAELVRPLAIRLDNPGVFRTLAGDSPAVVAPSFAVMGRHIIYAPDDRLMSWSLTGDGPPAVWTCWELPGGLAPQHAASEVYPLDEVNLVTYNRGTGTLTLFKPTAAF